MPKIGSFIKGVKSYILPAIIVVLIIALSVTQCQKQKFKQIDHTSEYQRAISIEKAMVVVLSNQAERLMEELYEQHEKDSVSVIAYNKEISYWRGKAKSTRVIVKTVIAENPQLEEFVSNQDSLIETMDVFIDTLQDQKADQWQNFNRLLAVTDQKFQASQEINTNLEALNKDLNKRVKRERAKKSAWKIVAGTLAAGIIYQSINN